MKEDFLHYLWRFRKFDTLNLHTTNNESVTILNQGQYLQLAGPDFFNAQIVVGDQKWAGNIEIHIKSSDWYRHHHEGDPAYENVILHVVWEHDTEVFRRDNIEIPVVVLKQFVAPETLDNYYSLMFPKTWINCEKQLSEVDDFLFTNWLERLFVERLERKSKIITDLSTQMGNDWEAVLFCLMAKNFGLNTNGETFLKIAQSIPFQIIRKESEELANIEALLFGRSGLLDTDKEDNYFWNLKSRFGYLSNKYKFETTHIAPVQFFKHRPDNFPTIRLSQLANLYFSRRNLFSEIIKTHSVKSIYAIFKVPVSDYWQTHYQFDKESPKKIKLLSKAFIDLIIINTIIPIQFAFAKSRGLEITETLIMLLQQIAAENNGVIDKFNFLGINARSAFETQSLLQLKSEYCNNGRCVDCAIGNALLRSGEP